MKLQLHPTKPYVIAELGTSCDGSVGNMIELARHCVAAGASAIKMQDHSFQVLPLGSQHPAWFQGSHLVEHRYGYVNRQSQVPNTDGDSSMFADWVDCMRKALPGVPLIVSPFAVRGVQLEPRPDAWKISSGNVTNHELIRACVATGLPIIVSSGMTTFEELVSATEPIPDDQLWAVLDCTSEYPCRAEHVAIGGDWDSWNGPGVGVRGFSDHTDPDSAAAAIVALTRGARVFERHVTFSQKMYGSDAKHACTLEQFERYCRELDFASRIPDRDIRDENAERLKETRAQFLVRSELDELPVPGARVCTCPPIRCSTCGRLMPDDESDGSSSCDGTDCQQYFNKCDSCLDAEGDAW